MKIHVVFHLTSFSGDATASKLLPNLFLVVTRLTNKAGVTVRSSLNSNRL